MLGGRKGGEPLQVADRSAGTAGAAESVRWVLVQNTLKIGARKQSGLAQPKYLVAVGRVAQMQLEERDRRPVAGERMKEEWGCKKEVAADLDMRRFEYRVSQAGGAVLLVLEGRCLHDS